MKIAIDLDEVIANHIEKLINFYHKKTGKLIQEGKFTTYDWWIPWGITKEEAIEIDHEFKKSKMFDNIKPVKNAFKSIKSIVENNKLFIITSRPTIYKERTEKWIKKNLPNIPITIIHSADFYSGSKLKTKVETCKDIGIDLILEDHIKYALGCAEQGIKVILFNKPWNQGVSHKNIIRVNNWIEALKEIQKITSKKS